MNGKKMENTNNKKINLTDLDINEINTLISGLLELPGKISLGLYTKIRQQVETQLQTSDNQMQNKNVNGPLGSKVI